MTLLLFENLQALHDAKKCVKESRDITPAEFNRLKFALNKNNTLKDAFVLTAVSKLNRYKTDDYHLCLAVYGYFKDIEPIENARGGVGTELYTVTINLIDETIKVDDIANDFTLTRDVKAFYYRINGNDEFYSITSKYDGYTELIDEIKDIINKSKDDITKTLKSKNFIYNLSANKIFHKSDKYTLDLDECSTLTEDFDPSMPNWLMRAIKIANNNHHHADDKYDYELDKLKWIVDDIPEKGKITQYTDKGFLYAVLIDKSGDAQLGDYVVFAPQLHIGNCETITINGRNRRIDSMAMQALTPYIKEIAYTKLDNSELQQKRQDRLKARDGEPKRFDNLTKPLGKDIDKSGYIVDPNKYTKLLAKLHLTDYSNRLSDLYVVLSNVKSKIKDFVNADDFLPDAKSTDSKYLVDYSASARDFQSIYGDYTRAIENYKYAMEELDNIEKEKENYWGDTPAFETFNKYVNNSEAYCAKVITKLDK